MTYSILLPGKRKPHHFLNRACTVAGLSKYVVSVDKSPLRLLLPVLENNPLDRSCFRHAECSLGMVEQLLMKMEVVFN